MFLNRFLVGILVFFCCTSLSAQDTTVQKEQVNYDTISQLSPVQFNEEAISEYKNEKAFSYIDKVQNDNWWSRFKTWIQMQYDRFKHWLFGDYSANAVLLLILEFLPYFILLLFLTFAVWLFSRLNPAHSLTAPPEEPSVFLNEEEKIVKSEDISKLIDKAIQQKDYRLAVRYYYLQLLRQLTRQGFISYEFQKTNSEYLTEIKSERFRSKFKKLIRIYDFIWYGNFSLSETDFYSAQASFKDLQAELNTIPNE